MDKQASPYITLPLSGRGKPIVFSAYDANGVRWVNWGEVRFTITQKQVEKILQEYFTECSRWYPLGASMTQPIAGGMGEYVQREFAPLGPRHVSAIAAVMVCEGLLESRGKNPIQLRRICKI